ncbi:MAG: hypothetical protein ACOVNZ_04500 [Crocinitomicaceae bacterium]|jgi:hypothetical protein
MYKIEINNQRKIKAIQNEFNEFFPHLKLAFYKVHHSSVYEQIKEFLDEKYTLDKCRTKKNNGYIFLDEEMTAEDLKSSLRNDFGLNLDIFHKIGKEQWSVEPIPNNQQLKEINFEIQ